MRDRSNPDPNAGQTLLVGAVGFILVLVIVLLLDVLYRRTAEAEAFRKQVAGESVQLQQLRQRQQQQLTDYRWVDSEQGIVAIPIERAMELIVEESR